MANARLVAINALVKIDKDKAYSNIILDKLFAESKLDSRDKALATTLVYGVLDRLITIDYIISRFSKAPVKKLSPMTAQAIRIAVFQLMFLERIPQSAAVNESVNIIKHSRESRNAGFVNAVLRNIIRNPVELPSGKTTEELSIRYSCPRWIINSFISDYGVENAIELLKYSLCAPPVNVRVNTLKASAEELKLLLSKQEINAEENSAGTSLEIMGGIDIRKNSLYNDGYFFVQDTASQTAVEKLSVKKGERVLDLCAAPGGKSFTMAIGMENRGEIVACDLYEHRVELIKKGADRLGITIIKPTVLDALKYNWDLGTFDAVLCDVPCSGLGVLRRKPEIKYKEITDFSEIEEIQQKILNNAATYLKAGGRLLYSTCTLRAAENEKAVSEFLSKNCDFTLEYQHTFMPHTDNTDGFFCALLIKK